MVVKNTTYAPAIELDPSDIYCWARFTKPIMLTEQFSFVATSSLILIILLYTDWFSL